MKEYLDLFLQESAKQLASMEKLLLGNSGRLAGPELDAMFREVHSLKGMAATMGYRALTDLSHRIEDLLGRFRAAGEPAGPEEVALCLRCRDRMERIYEDVAAGRDGEIDISDLAAPLAKALSGGSRPAPEGASPKSSRSELHPGATADAGGLTAVITIDPECPTPTARAYVSLQRFREIAPDLSSVPTEDEIKGGVPVRELSLVLPGASVEDVRCVYDTLTDVAGLRFPEPVAAPCPSPKPLADTPASAGIDFPREGELKNSEAILAAGIPAELGLPETVEVSTRILDELLEIVGELTLTRARVNALAQGERMQPLQDEARRMGALLRKLDEGVMNARLLPFSLIAGRLRRFVREQAEVLGKEVQLTVSGERIGLDKAVMLRLSGALVHLLRNALDHGMETAAERSASGKRETGSITISLDRERNALRLRVADDGRGIDTEAVLARAVERGLTSAEDASTLPRDRIFEFLFAPGFSTRKEVGALSGRGVGLDAVRTEIMRMGGSVAVNAESGRGTEFLIELPVSPAVAPVLLVEVEGLPLAFPVHSVLRTYEAMRSDLRKDASGKFVFLHDKQEYPLRTLASQIGVEARLDPKRFAVVAVGFGEKVGCWAVDRLLREEEVFVKPFRGPWARLRGVTGYSLLGDGRLVYLLEPAELTAV